MTDRIPIEAWDPAGGLPGQSPLISADGTQVEWASGGGGGGGGSGYSFSGAETKAGLDKNASASGSHSGKSWIVSLNVAVRLTGMRLDIRTSSTYTVTIDGVVVFTGPLSPGVDQLVTFASSVYLDSAAHVIGVSCSSSVLHYYYDSTANRYSADLGAGGRYVTRWEPPLEGGSHFGARLVFVPGVFAP